MHRIVGVTAAAAALIVGAAYAPSSARAQSSAPEQGASQNEPATQRSESRTVNSSGNVEKIDKQNRMVTLKTDQGETFDVKVGPTVNLDRVKRGDRVNAQYYEEVVVDLKPTGRGAPPSMTQRTVERGGVAAKQTTVTAEIISADAKNNVVVVKGPRGTHTLHVQDPAIQAQLGKIKPRDNVTVTYTQAVAVSLEPNK